MNKLKEFYSKAFVSELSCSNIDDVLRAVANEGIDEVEVSNEEMAYIADFARANLENADLRDKIFIERKIDKVFGIKLVLVK